MSEPPIRIRGAGGAPFALRFIALGAAGFAIGLLSTVLTGGEVWDKAARRAMTAWEVVRLAALLASAGAGLWWLGGRARRVQDGRSRLPSGRSDPM